MTTTAQFTGSIPAIYDRDLGPFLFDWTAEELSKRVNVPAGGRVLEIACGTGIATEALRRALPLDVEIVASDLNEAMLREAGRKRGNLLNVSYCVCDAQALPFEQGSFDAVVCQFGLMFFPEKIKALREARRVLRPGGQLLFSTWASLDGNPAVREVHEVLRAFFPEDPPRFLETPFGLHDPVLLLDLFDEIGVRDVAIEVCDHEVELPSARSVARGLVRGTPGVLELESRDGPSLDLLVDVAETTLAARFGTHPFRSPLCALFISARR